MMFDFDAAIHVTELSIMLIVFRWGKGKVEKVIDLLSTMSEYPPHRHVGEAIVYPKGHEPSRLEHLAASE